MGIAAASLWLRLARDGPDEVGRHDDVVRVAAEARERHHVAADLVPRRSWPDRIDVARHFVAHHQRRRRRVRIEAHARENVGEVHAAGLHADADFARAGLGRRALALLQDFRTAVTGDDDFAHRFGSSANYA